ncbi:MAG: COX15/CtaA family protein [Anaerolineales bacterium]|nr:COX15/CtaA family protein [Anaerolineales bacterium]
MQLTRFAKFAWGVLVYNLGVILWGAYVRATGSGAGCGNYWPLCNGEIAPRALQVETIIELIHRLASSLAFLLVLVMLIWALHLYPKGHAARVGAGFSLLFIIAEVLIGAVLVLFGWVADDISTGRMVTISVHLVNTFLLLASLTLTAWWASGGEMLHWSGYGAILWMFVLGFLGVLLLGVSGAIIALGDMLFPGASLAEGVAQNFSQQAHFISRLRAWHPSIAIATGLYLLFLSGLVAMFRVMARVRRCAAALAAVFVAQLLAGLVDLFLLAPVWMQLAHLLLANLVWIALVLLTATNFACSEICQTVHIHWKSEKRAIS